MKHPIFELIGVLRRNDPVEVRSHLRALAQHVADQSSVEDLISLAAGEAPPGEFDPPRAVLMERIENAADRLLESGDPFNCSKSGNLVWMLAGKASTYALTGRIGDPMGEYVAVLEQRVAYLEKTLADAGCKF